MGVSKKFPFLSIIVPVYKVEKYLPRCINSIINQEFKDYELILVDDGSPDKSGVICDAYARKDNRIRVIHKKNSGLGSARNAGLKIATGEYVGFVDSDDWISSDMYSFLTKVALKYKADIVASSYTLTKGSSKINQKKYYIKCLEGQEKLKFYLKFGMKYRVSDYSVCNKIYKLKLFKSIQFPEGQLYEDGATNFMLIKAANKYIKSNKITYYYFQDNNSIIRNGFKKQDYDLLLVSKQMVGLARAEGNPQLIKLSRMKEARSYFSMLSKVAAYGIQDDFDNPKETIQILTNKLRDNYVLLLKSPMPFNRKLIMTLLCLNIKLVSFPIKIFLMLKDTYRKN